MALELSGPRIEADQIVALHGARLTSSNSFSTVNRPSFSKTLVFMRRFFANPLNVVPVIAVFSDFYSRFAG